MNQLQSTYQLNIFTQEPEIAGDIVDRITFLLREYPDTRNDYKTLVARYWLHFDGLNHVIARSDSDDAIPNDIELTNTFLHWMRTTATSPKTIQNRAMEIQSAHPELDADPFTRARRNAQARQGPIR